MNNFGLGLVLSFTDNASSGMQRATRTFEDLNNATSNFSLANDVDSALMSISYAAGVVGDELFQVGQNITSLFTSVISNVTQTGTAIATARTQLSTLYGSDEAGVQKLAEIKEYAKSSIFNFEDLIPSVIMLKANGIEAFDKIASSAYLAGDATSQANQTLMDYAADLAAFNPQMRNSYGTGIQAAMGALNEYIAEGNAMSLKRGASLDINQLIGEETADTIEERSRQVADLIEKLGMVGMTANLANTPMQRLSNVSDIFFNLMSDVSDSGVFEKYSSLIAKFTDYLFKIPDEELKNIAEVIGGALTDLMTPFEKLIDVGIKVVDWIRDLVKTRPELVQTAIKATAVAGAFLLISGVVLKLGSSLGFLRISLSGLFKGGITNGAGILGLIINLTRYIFPLISAVTLLKLAWDRNFLGIRDVTTETLTKVWETFKLVVDAFADNTLSEEAFKKAQEMGVLPLIESILQLKYHWGFFVDGFKKGLDAFVIGLSNCLVKLGILDIDVSSLGDLFVALADKITAPGMTDTWEKIGYFIGESAGYIMLFIALLPTAIKAFNILLTTVKAVSSVIKTVYNVVKFIVKVPGRIASIVTKIVDAVKWVKFLIQYFWETSNVVRKVIGFIAKIPQMLSKIPALFGAIKSGIVWILTGIGTIVTAILGAMGVVVTLPAWVVGLITVAVVAAITGLVALIVHFWDEIKAFFINVGLAIKDFFVGVWDTISNNSVVKSVIRIVTTIKDFIVTVINNVVDVVKSFASFIVSIAKGVFNIIKSIVTGIWNIIKSIVNLIKNIVYTVYEFIRVIVLGIIFVVKTIWDEIQVGLNFVYNLFATIFGWIYNNVISPAVDSISTAFNWLCNNVFSPVGDFISNVFENIADVVDWLVDKFKTGFGTVRDFICDAIQTASDFVIPILEGIADVINQISDSISGIIDAASGAIGWAGDKLKSAGNALTNMVGLSTGGYVKTTGIAVLHPNEVVVNDYITQELKSFLSDYRSGNTLREQPVVNQTIVTNSTQKSYSNQFNGSTDDSNMVETLTTLNSTLGVIGDNIKESTLSTLGLNIPSTSVVNNYPTSVINNDVVNENGTKFDDSNVVRSLLNLNSTLNTLGLSSKPTSIINNNTVNENTTKLDEVKTVEVLIAVLNTITEKSNSIVGLIKNRSSVRYDTGDNYNTKLALTIKGLVESIGDYDKRHYDNSPLIRQDIVADDNYSERPEIVTVETPPEDNIDKDRPVENSPMQTLVENNTVLNNNNKVENNRSDSSSSSDNRVIFNSGSITIKVDSNGGKISKEELNNCADELLQIITRKLQLRGLQTRK